MTELDKRVVGAMEAAFREDQARKLADYRQRNRYIRPGQLLFTGSSLMEMFPITEYCQEAGVPLIAYNRAIGGYTTDDFLAAIDDVLLDVRASRIFINIGTNDIAPRPDGRWLEHLTENYRAILRALRQRNPRALVYMMAYYPVNSDHPRMRGNPAAAVRTNENIDRANAAARALAGEFGYRYIDVNDGIKDATGSLMMERTLDGIHMDAEAYHRVFEALLPHILEP